MLHRQNPSERFTQQLWGVLLFLLIARLVAMFFIPLNDPSEARYGEIARKMVETGNWVTLWHEYGVPFWAKPPLSTWASALSMTVLGVNAFAARLPALLFSIAVLGLIYDLVKRRSGNLVAAFSVLVLASNLYFFVDAGTVMTDPVLVFSVTLILVSFWHAMVEKRIYWSYVFFLGLGLGLLAKGPVALVLSGLPIFFWVLWQNQWHALWQRLPWFKGSIVTLAVALPWYLWAELRTPGFLDYFFVGENFHRFVTPGWAGDKYGTAHRAAWGMIWIYSLIGIFPWCLLGGIWFIRFRRSLPSLWKDKDGWMSYLVFCTFVPLFFFTFSSNIIYTYVFPSLPFFAVFFTEYWVRAGAMWSAKRLMLALALIPGLVFFGGTMVFLAYPELSKTQKAVITAWQQQQPMKGSYLVYWRSRGFFSAQFYSQGRVRFVSAEDELCALLANHLENYLVVSPDQLETLPDLLRTQLQEKQRIKLFNKEFILLQGPVNSCTYLTKPKSAVGT